jgi:predicted nucleotidyltransferase
LNGHTAQEKHIQMKLNKQDIQKIKNYLIGQPVEKAYLFGSHARETAGAASDVDILVELDYSKPVGLQFVRMQLELESILQARVDLLSDRGISKYIRPYIENDKKLIYEKEH